MTDLSNEEREALENRRVKMEGPLPKEKMFLKAAEVHERLSEIPRLRIEFSCTDENIGTDQFVGKHMRVGIQDDDDAWYFRSGTCVDLTYLGVFRGRDLYGADVRPWLWFLTRRRDNRIFQDMSAVEIIEKILGDAGLSGNLEKKLSGTYQKRVYCVQFGETDFAFISRLMEQEGIYYYFDHSADPEKLVLIDEAGSHPKIPGEHDVPYSFKGSVTAEREHSISEWYWSERVTSGKVTVDDYDFEKPRTDLKSAKPLPQGSHSHKDYEVYDYPGFHYEAGLGDDRARTKMESIAASHKIITATSNHRRLAVGHVFKLTEHERTDMNNKEFMITEAVFQYQIEQEFTIDEERQRESGEGPGDREKGPGSLTFPEEHRDAFRCEFKAIKKETQFRAPILTPWPRLSGLQTAEVVGPDNEEIYTDKYGRIKVKFHWDRRADKGGRSDPRELGDANHDERSCWIRVMTPWSGNRWGQIAVPRIGQEVVVDFEQGDPDRPIVVGMLYKDTTMPPYTLPDDKMISGVKTNRYKEGGGFHELIMDDTKEAELIRFQSERDYEQIVKNNADIKIGMEHNDAGDLTQEVYNDATYKWGVGSGSGSVTETVEKDLTRTVNKGNQDVTISQGNYSVDVQAGKVTIEAAQSIELKVGATTIKLDPTSIKMSTQQFKVDAKMTAEVVGKMSATLKSNLMAKVDGGVNVTVKAGMVLIN